jgi:ribosomal protein L13
LNEPVKKRDPERAIGNLSAPLYTPNMDVHHVDYDRIGKEEFGDLVILCRDCHEVIEKRIRKMVNAGRTRRNVMRRLKPYMINRLFKIHEAWREPK